MIRFFQDLEIFVRGIPVIGILAVGGRLNMRTWR